MYKQDGKEISQEEMMKAQKFLFADYMNTLMTKPANSFTALIVVRGGMAEQSIGCDNPAIMVATFLHTITEFVDAQLPKEEAVKTYIAIAKAMKDKALEINETL